MSVHRRMVRGQNRDRRMMWALALLTVIGLLSAAAGVTVSSVLASVARDLPKLDIADHQPITENTYIYDGAAKPHLLAVLRGDESRVIVGSDQIAPVLKQAVVAVEDRRFYQHQGVDYDAIVRALFADVTAGHTVQGGSTITQQFIKNAYLPQDQRTDQSFSRKLREAVLAYQLEKQWPKDKILTNYLNTIYFGQGAYGVEMAARTFFGTTAKRLTLSQAALLAGVIRDPSIDDPFLAPQLARERRRIVLDDMVAQGYATADDAAAAAAQPLPRHPHGLPKSHIAPYFVSYIIQELVSEFGAARAFGGGLRVYTTIDPAAQRAANTAAHSILNGSDDPSVALVAIDPRTGEVRAMVGGRDFHRQQFNVAVQGHRQPGSAFKPFGLIAAIKQSMSPRTIFYSEPKSIDMGPGAAPWNVSTYSGTYAGPITLAEATVYSDNSVYADLSMIVGPENIAAAAHSMGIASAVGTNPSIALGGLEQGVTPMEMANAYATLASGGERLGGSRFGAAEPQPISIVKVTDADGDVILRNTLVRQRVLQRWQAGVVTSILQQVIMRGTGTAAYLGRPCAGKTGTTTNYADAWFCGYTPDLAAVVWVGYPGSQRPLYVHGIRVAGGTFPAMIWRSFMSGALAGVPAHGFSSYTEPPVKKAIICSRTGDLATRWCPERLTAWFYNGDAPTRTCSYHQPKPVAVPQLAGLPLEVAERQLRALKLEWQTTAAPSTRRLIGYVVGQDPPAGKTTLQGTRVTLQVGAGPTQLVPDVVGLYREAAEQIVADAGLACTVEFNGATGDPGMVAAQSPPGGSGGVGSVTISVNGSDQNVTVPVVEGRTVADARAVLAQAGLGYAVSGTFTDTSRVAGQMPRAGAQLRIGATVSLTVE